MDEGTQTDGLDDGGDREAVNNVLARLTHTVDLYLTETGGDAVDRPGLAELVEDLYGRLKFVARSQKRRFRGTPIETTGLVHEAYLKLYRPTDDQAGRWHSEEHFLSVAATAMRHILVDLARMRSRQKRGGAQEPITLDHRAADQASDWQRWESILEVDQALRDLQQEHAELVQVVECRFFIGLDEAATAKVIGVSLRTCQRLWRDAKLRLREHLAPTH